MKIDSWIQIQRLPGGRYAAKVKPGRKAKPLYTKEYNTYKEALQAARDLALAPVIKRNPSKISLIY